MSESQITHTWFPIDAWLGCFYFYLSTTANGTSVNTLTHVSLKADMGSFLA
jgi:hypothetical protein